MVGHRLPHAFERCVLAYSYADARAGIHTQAAPPHTTLRATAIPLQLTKGFGLAYAQVLTSPRSA